MHDSRLMIVKNRLTESSRALGNGASSVRVLRRLNPKSLPHIFGGHPKFHICKASPEESDI